MWQLEYSNEAKFYFLDNYPYTFDLLVEIEKLKYYTEAELPGVEFQPRMLRWEVLEHLVYYGKIERTLVIAVIKPIG